MYCFFEARSTRLALQGATKRLLIDSSCVEHVAVDTAWLAVSMPSERSTLNSSVTYIPHEFPTLPVACRAGWTPGGYGGRTPKKREKHRAREPATLSFPTSWRFVEENLIKKEGRDGAAGSLGSRYTTVHCTYFRNPVDLPTSLLRHVTCGRPHGYKPSTKNNRYDSVPSLKNCVVGESKSCFSEPFFAVVSLYRLS